MQNIPFSNSDIHFCHFSIGEEKNIINPYIIMVRTKSKLYVKRRKMNNDTAKKGLGELKLYGAPWYITIIGCLVVIAAAYTGALETDFASIMVLIIAYGILFFELGERLPIWNSYIGGGVLAAFFGTAIIRQLSLIPKEYLEPINEFIGGDTINFTSIWIIVLITGSVLSLEKKILLKSFVGYFPAILGGLAAAMGFGVLSGLFFWNFSNNHYFKVCTASYGRRKWRRSCSDVRNL